MRTPQYLTLNIDYLNTQIRRYMMDHIVDFSYLPVELVLAYINGTENNILQQHPTLKEMIHDYLTEQVYETSGYYYAHVVFADTLGMHNVLLLTLDLNQSPT